jgi:hypothetical protein
MLAQIAPRTVVPNLILPDVNACTVGTPDKVIEPICEICFTGEAHGQFLDFFERSEPD